MNLRFRSIVALLSTLFLGVAASSFGGQSLADVARREAARRKTIKAPAKVLTNKDLGTVPAAPEGAATSAPAAMPSSLAEAASAEERPAEQGPARDKAYWSKRMKDVQNKLDRDQVLAAALQSRISALTADFTSHDDPAQRAQIAQDRDKALAEFNRLQQGVEDDKKAIADLLEEARRAGVPPGWLRF